MYFFGKPLNSGTAGKVVLKVYFPSNSVLFDVVVEGADVADMEGLLDGTEGGGVGLLGGGAGLLGGGAGAEVVGEGGVSLSVVATRVGGLGGGARLGALVDSLPLLPRFGNGGGAPLEGGGGGAALDVLVSLEVAGGVGLLGGAARSEEGTGGAGPGRVGGGAGFAGAGRSEEGTGGAEEEGAGLEGGGAEEDEEEGAGLGGGADVGGLFAVGGGALPPDCFCNCLFLISSNMEFPVGTNAGAGACALDPPDEGFGPPDEPLDPPPIGFPPCCCKASDLGLRGLFCSDSGTFFNLAPDLISPRRLLRSFEAGGGFETCTGGGGPGGGGGGGADMD